MSITTHKHNTQSLYFLFSLCRPTSHQVRRVRKVFETDEVLLDAARGDEAVENADAPSLVICSTRARAAEGLLPHDRASALFVVVYVPRSVAQAVCRGEQRGSVRGEAEKWLSEGK